MINWFVVHVVGEIFLNQENCQEVMVAADMFNLSELVTFCAEYLQKQLHPTNCIGKHITQPCCTSSHYFIYHRCHSVH